MDISKNEDDESNDTELDVLIDIRSEMRSLSAELARIDERSAQTNEEVARLRDERVIPVEEQADRNTGRSQRNAIILSGGLSAAVIIFTWAIGIFPL